MARLASFCLRAARRYSRMDEEEGEDDPLVWSRDLASQPGGEFSFAVVQANEPIEDQSQLEACPGATFVGIYDGHGGSEASRFVSDHLLPHLIRLAREEGGVSEGVIRRAFYETEEGFMGVVRRARGMRPLIAAAGSCCLAGIIWKGTLYAANLGDSRAVVGRVGRSNGIVAEQLTEEHNAGVDSVRRELVAAHPDDSHIVVLKHGVWRIKGIIQVSRSIGDAYLKRGEFRMDPAYHRFRLPEPLRRPVISAEPSISTKVLSPQDKFLIFASDGLWEHVTNQEAAEMVHSHPRSGIARRLARRALERAARKRKARYEDVKKVKKEARRFFHDDITVVVVFLDGEPTGEEKAQISVRGFSDSSGSSNFSLLAQI
ncbi:putative protein phosphatase 2C 25 isoform X2 [Wolffia australiana]